MCSWYEGFPGGSHSKGSACTAENPGSVPESEGSPEGNESYFINMCMKLEGEPKCLYTALWYLFPERLTLSDFSDT